VFVGLFRGERLRQRGSTQPTDFRRFRSFAPYNQGVSGKSHILPQYITIDENSLKTIHYLNTYRNNQIKSQYDFTWLDRVVIYRLSVMGYQLVLSSN
jgi:hypothetical protein